MLPLPLVRPASWFARSSRGIARLGAILSALGGIGVVALAPWSGRAPSAAVAVPVMAAGDTQVVYGPHVFSTPTGKPTTYVERFGLVVQPTRRYTLRLVNGAADGTHKANGGSVQMNGELYIQGTDIRSGATLTRVVEALTEDTLLVNVEGTAGSFFTLSVLADPDPTFNLFAERFTRTGNQSATDTRSFALPAGAAPPYYLHVVNGNVDGTTRFVDGSIVLNGLQVLTFDKNVAAAAVQVTLQAQNTFQVVGRAQTSGFVDVRFGATDTTPPVITITSPAPGLITRDTLVSVAGSVQDQTATTVTVNGQAASMSGTSFTTTARLTTEGPDTLHIVATDAAGHTTDSTRTVIRDTQAPVLTVNAPADHAVTNQTSVTVSGTVTDQTAVTVNANGIPLPVDRAGVFTGSVPLSEGANMLTVTATDAAGNQSVVVRTVTRDTQAPVLIVTAPADGATVNADHVTVTGTVSDATAVTLTVNGATTPVATDGSFTATVSLAVGTDTITLIATDAATNRTTLVRTVVRRSPLPPDPVTVASVVNRAEVTTIGDATAFLYTGANPIQTGVAAGTINPVRAAVIRGRVFDRAFHAVGGAAVTILGHPELGQTLSREDGGYDLAVNGGGALTVSFGKAGYFPAQRTTTASWQDYTTLDDVILLQPDSAVTVVDLTSATPAVARSSVTSDADGARQATLIVKPGTQATLTNPDGSTRSLTSLAVRATEYTVGDSGALSMPAALPPASQYTYAVQLSADEQLAAGPGAQIALSQPAPVYVTNFLHVPVGTAVPVGIYDATKGTWVPQHNGIALRILGTDSTGRARIDINGDGQADPPSALAALGIDDYEVVQLGGLYPAGSDLWRALAPTFQPEDLNFPFIFVGSAPTDGKVKAGCSSRDGDPIRCQLQAQTAFQSVGIVGSPFTLNYASDRTQGNAADRKLDITLTGPTLQDQLLRVELEVDVAGKRFQGSFTPQPNLTYTFNWDGKDIYGRLTQGTQPATVLIGYVFPVQYAAPANATDAFGQPCAPTGTGSACSIIANAQTGARAERTLVQTFETSIGTLDATALGLGGFTLDVQNVYDPVGQVLYKGDGTRRATAALPPGIRTVGGTGAFQGPFRPDSENVPALRQQLDPRQVAIGPDGSIYFNDRAFLIRKITPDGLLHNILGNPGTWAGVSSGDGGPAALAQAQNIAAIALGPDGSIYFSDVQRIRKIDPSGIVNTVAGTGTAGYSGDGGPATAAQLRTPQGIAVGPDGALYIADRSNLRIRRVGPDGIITTFAGDGSFCGQVGGFPTDASFNALCGNGVPALRAKFAGPQDLTFGADGALYISEPSINRVRRVGPDGIIRTFAGSSNTQNYGDGGQATLASVPGASGLAVGLDGSVYITAIESRDLVSLDFRVRRVASTGIITTVVGTGAFIGNSNQQGWAGDGGPAPAAQLGQIASVAVGPDGNLVIPDNERIRKVAGFLPGFGAGQTVVASEDGSALYVFSSGGRLLFTLNAVTRDTVYRFSYNAARQLVSITDANGLVSTIERDAAGAVTAFVGPNGQQTAVALDGNGHIANLLGPDGSSVAFQLDGNGMLFAAIDQRGDTVGQFRYDSGGKVLGLTNELGGTNSYSSLGGGGAVSVQSPSYPLAVVDTELAVGGNQVMATLNNRATVQTTFGADGSAITTTPDGMVTTLTTTPDPLFGMQAPLRTESIRTPSGLVRLARTSASVTLQNPSDPSSVTVEVDSLMVNGRASTTKYDKASRTVTTTTAGGRTIAKLLDTLGHVTRVTGTAVPTITQTFDSRGRVVVRSFGSRTTRFGYDSLDRVDSITDPLGRTRKFRYDAAGRLVERDLPDGRIVRLGYDASGNLTSVTPPGRPAHIMSFNAAGKMITYTAPDTTLVGPVLRYGYDASGRLASITRADGSASRITYDTSTFTQTTVLPGGDTLTLVRGGSNANVTTARLTGGASVAYAYDGALLTASTWSGPIQGSVSRTYDSDFRVATQSVNGGSQVSFTYDPDGYLTAAGALSLTRSPGTWVVATTGLSGVTTANNYNTSSELVATQATFGSDTIYAVTIQRDSVGRIAAKQERIGGISSAVTFSYDSAGRLATVTRDGVAAESYEYDPNGNRTRATTSAGSVTGSVDARDRLLTYGQARYEYSPNGEQLRKISGNDSTRYTYDALGNLRTVVQPGGTVIDYVVDGQGRRVGKKVNGVVVKGWLYDGELTAVAELDGAGQVVSRFVYSQRPNVPEYMIRGGVTYRILTDERGSVRLVVDVGSGNVVQRLEYDAFGRVTLNSNPGFQPFGFAGGVYDEQTGLVRFGSRDYDAETGRWTAPDPLLFSGGDENLYAYAQNDPVNIVDPNGREWLLGVGIGAAIGFVDGVLSSDGNWTGVAQSTLTGAIGGLVGGGAGEVVGGLLERVVTNVVARLMVSGAIAGGLSNIAIQVANNDGEITDPGAIVRATIVGALSAGAGNLWAGRMIQNGVLTYAHLEQLEALTSSIAADILEFGAKKIGL